MAGKRVIVIVIVIMVALALGLIGGYVWGFTKGSASVTAFYAPKIAQVDALFPAETTTHVISGQIEEINGTILTVTENPVTPNPFVDQGPAIREVTITSSTQITSVGQKDPAEFQAEMQAFAKQAVTASSSVARETNAPPSPFVQTNIVLSDLKQGDTITVTADSNILEAASFTATTVQKQVGN